MASYKHSIQELDNHFEFDIFRRLRVDVGYDESGGEFEIQIPAQTLSKDNITKRAVFTLKSFTISNLDKNNAGDLNMIRAPFFQLHIGGLGMKPNHYNIEYKNQGFSKDLINNTYFLIPNVLAQVSTILNAPEESTGMRVVGNDNCDSVRLCSNPFGTMLTFKVRRSQQQDCVFTTGKFINVKFCIDFIDPEEDQNFY